MCTNIDNKYFRIVFEMKYISPLENRTTVNVNVTKI